jgi:hypothetical protein
MGRPFLTWQVVLLPLLSIFDLPFSFDEDGRKKLAELYTELGYVEFTKLSVLICHVLTKLYSAALNHRECYLLMLKNKPIIFVPAINECVLMFNDPIFHNKQFKESWSKHL